MLASQSTLCRRTRQQSCVSGSPVKNTDNAEKVNITLPISLVSSQLVSVARGEETVLMSGPPRHVRLQIPDSPAALILLILFSVFDFVDVFVQSMWL